MDSGIMATQMENYFCLQLFDIKGNKLKRNQEAPSNRFVAVQNLLKL
jgi:hypothetical protein